MALSEKLKAGEIVIVDSFKIGSPKTKLLSQSINSILPKDAKGSVLIILSKRDENITKASRNIPKLNVVESREVSVLDVLSAKYVVLEKESIEAVSSRIS